MSLYKFIEDLLKNPSLEIGDVAFYKEYLQKKLLLEIDEFDRMINRISSREHKKYSDVSQALQILKGSVERNPIDIAKVSSNLQYFIGCCQITGLWKQNEIAAVHYKASMIVLAITFATLTLVCFLGTMAVGLANGIPLVVLAPSALAIVLIAWGGLGLVPLTVSIINEIVSDDNQPAEESEFNNSAERISHRGKKLTTFFKENSEVTQDQNVASKIILAVKTTDSPSLI